MKYLYYLYIEYYYMLVDQNSFIREFFNSLQGPLDRSPYIIFSQQSIFDIPTFEISLVDVRPLALLGRHQGHQLQSSSHVPVPSPEVNHGFWVFKMNGGWD